MEQLTCERMFFCKHPAQICYCIHKFTTSQRQGTEDINLRVIIHTPTYKHVKLYRKITHLQPRYHGPYVGNIEQIDIPFYSNYNELTTMILIKDLDDQSTNDPQNTPQTKKRKHD